MYSFLLSFYVFILAYWRKVSSRSAVTINLLEPFENKKDDKLLLTMESRNIHTLYEFYNDIMSHGFKIIGGSIENKNELTTIVLAFDENKSLELKECTQNFADYHEELVDVYFNDEHMQAIEIGLQKGLD